MAWTRVARRLFLAYGVAVLIAGWVVLVLILAAAHATGEPVTVDPNAFDERFLELVLIVTAGPSIGWTIRGSLNLSND